MFNKVWKYWTFIIILNLILVVSVLIPLTSSAENQAPIVLGLHPYQPEKTLQDLFTPLAEYLEVVLERPVSIRVGSSYQDHVHAVAVGITDIAFMGPAGYVNLTSLFGEHYILGKIVTNGEPFFFGHIVVRENSPIISIDQLVHKRLAFVNRFSTMYLVPYAMMKQAGLTQEDLSGQEFLKSHQNVALGVLAGDFSAGAIKDEVFLQFKDRGLRSLITTMSIPEHIFVASDKLDQELKSKIRDALLGLYKSEKGREILKGIKKSLTAVIEAKDSDYDQLRELLKFLDKDY